jgi:hypothetical protein
MSLDFFGYIALFDHQDTQHIKRRLKDIPVENIADVDLLPLHVIFLNKRSLQLFKTKQLQNIDSSSRQPLSFFTPLSIMFSLPQNPFKKSSQNEIQNPAELSKTA